MTYIDVRAFVSLSLILFVLGMSACNKPSAPQSQVSNPPRSQPAPVDSAKVASISGTVSFHGVAPKPVKIDMSNDPACQGDNRSEQVVADDGHLANVLIYVKDGLGTRAFDAPKQALIVKQRGCRYAPHVAAVMVGQPVDFVDDDQTLHNIHPSPKNNPEWNQSQMPNSAPIDKTFRNPEIMMPVKCNQHPWMKMYLSVIGNPYFTVTGKDGKFSLTGLPPGTYTIAAVHEKYGEQDDNHPWAQPGEERRGVQLQGIAFGANG